MAAQRAAARGRASSPVRSNGGGGARGPRHASPRVRVIVGVFVLLVGLGFGLGIAFSKGKKAPGIHIAKHLPTVGSDHWAGSLHGAREANAVFQGIPQHGLVLGKPSAPVEMEMFVDVQCPVCRYYETTYLPAIVQSYVRPGKVQIHLQPWAFIGGKGSQSFSGRLGLIAASFQDKGFEYAKVLYDNQGIEDTGWLTDPVMDQIAASVNGLKLKDWSAGRAGSRAAEIASRVDALAKTDGIGGTPTVLVGPTGGKLTDITPTGSTNAPDLHITKKALDAALKTI